MQGWRKGGNYGKNVTGWNVISKFEIKVKMSWKTEKENEKGWKMTCEDEKKSKNELKKGGREQERVDVMKGWKRLKINSKKGKKKRERVGDDIQGWKKE